MGSYLYLTTCDVTCPTKYFRNTTTRECQSCKLPCDACDGAESLCTTCQSGFYLEGSTCRSSCSPGFYLDAATTSCLPCLAPCLTCQTSADHCLSCSPPKLFQLNRCRDSCLAGYFPVLANYTCSACLPNCQSCTNASVCLTCFPGYETNVNQTCSCNQGTYQVSNGSCVLAASCPPKTYPDSTARQCLACKDSCLTCANAAECLTCDSTVGLVLSASLTACVCQDGSKFFDSATQ